MNNILTSCMLAAAVLVSAASCKKADNDTCTAGGGGNVEIVVFATHNGKALINSAQHPDTAFVKYSSVVAPAAGNYDAYYIGEAGEDHIHLTNLLCGQYYIYRTAYDTTTNTRYTGSLAVTVTKTSGEVDTTIVVN